MRKVTRTIVVSASSLAVAVAVMMASSIPAKAAAFFTAPSAPTDLKVAGNSCPATSSPSPQLSWTAPVGGATGYNIVVTETGGGTDVVDFETAHDYYDSNLAAGTYLWHVRAFNGFNPKEYSDFSDDCFLTITATP